MFIKDFKDHLLGDTWDGANIELIINGSPKNLTGVEIKCEIRYGQKTGPVKKTLTVDSGITVTDATAGKCKLDAFVVDLAPGVYFYDVQFKTGDTYKTYVGGKWNILQDVTKW